jgi:hypothetical protein
MMAFVTMTAAGRFYNFCIAMKTENGCRDSAQHTVRILATLGADRVNEQQADAGVSTPGSVNAK